MAASVLPHADEIGDLVPRPGSTTWRIAGDARLLVAAGYALVLQVAHPVVGAGVAEHSDYQQDPWGRLVRTLDYVNVTVFGGADAAAEMGRRVRGRHTSIKGVMADGTRYHSLEPEAFAWVHATLAVSILAAHHHFGRRLQWWERDVFWRDWRRLGRLVGVRDRDLPESYDGFRRYVERTTERTLTDNPTVHGVLATLSRPSSPGLPLLVDPAWRVLRLPAARAVRVATVGLMTPGLRRRLNLGFTAADAVQFRALSAASRSVGVAMPAGMREFGPAYLTWRRAAIARTGIRV